MLTHTVEGVPCLPDDDSVVSRLHGAVLPTGAAKHTGQLGIQGPDGRVYRVVLSESFAELSQTLETLGSLGFIGRRPPQGRYAAVFSRDGRDARR